MVHSSPTSWLVVLIVGLVALSGLQIYNGFVHRSPGSVVDRNRLCTANDTKRPSYCDMSGRTGTPQFKKILWFVTDGLPVRYSTSLLNYFSDHSVTYVIDVPGAKYSHAIYTSWLTGQGTYTNYEGSDIQGDSLIERMVEAGMNLRYAGPEWSFLALLGSQNYQRLFKNIDLHHEPLHEQSLHIYPFFFENMTAVDNFYNKLWPELERENQSLITHSGIFDHFSHGVFRSGSNETLLNGYSLRAQEDLMALRALVDSNPEYLLILSSDHGVDEITSHGYVLHGFTRDGNEGYLMLYNPMLEPSHERPIIDVTDVCATIAKYLENVDIPFNNIGIARSYYGPRGKLKQVKALKQNLHQLSQSAEWRGKLDARMKLDVQALLHERYTTGDDQLIQKLYIAATELKAVMYDTMEAPTDRVFTSTIALSLLLLVAFQIFFGIGNLLSIVRHRPLLALVYLAVFVFVLFAPLGHLLFMSVHWTRVFQQGTVFYLPSLSLAFVQIALLARIWSYDSLSPTRRSSPLSAVCYTAISMLVINESINWLLLALSLLFRGHWKSWFSALPGSRELVYALALLLAWVQLWPSAGRRFTASNNTGQSRASFLVVLLVALLLLTYEWTVSANEAYVVFGFHVAFAAAFLVGLAAVLYHVLVQRSVHSVSAGFSLLLLVLWMDSNTGRLMHLTWNSQGLLLLYPVFELVRLASTMLHSPPESLRVAQEHRHSVLPTLPLDVAIARPGAGTADADDDDASSSTSASSASQPVSHAPVALVSPSVELSLRIESRLLILATFVYIANSTFYHLAVNMGDRVSLDVHPFVGRVGVRSYDEYPTLAGFFMVWHKYGVFLSFVFNAVAAAAPAVVDNLFNLHQSRISPFCAHAMKLLESLPKHVQLRWIANQPRAAESGTVVLIVTSIFYAAALTGHCWLLAAYSPDLALEESVVFSLLWAALSGIMFVLILISRFLSKQKPASSSISLLLEKEHAFD